MRFMGLVSFYFSTYVAPSFKNLKWHKEKKRRRQHRLSLLLQGISHNISRSVRACQIYEVHLTTLRFPVL